MSALIKSYPLCWPEGWKRTTDRKSSDRYKVSFTQAYDDALQSLRKFGAIGVVISTDVPLRRDGKPYSDGDPPDPGVAIYFTRGQRPFVMACDQWQSVRANMRAIGLAIVSGFAALPSGSGVRHPDAGGTHEAMLELNEAHNEALKEIAQ